MTVQGELTRISARVQITRPEKILFPEDKITKQDLVDYYRRIAPWILPHLRGRPLALERYPDGIDRAGLFTENRSRLLSALDRNGDDQKENRRHGQACRLQRCRHADLSGKSGVHHCPYLAQPRGPARLSRPDGLRSRSFDRQLRAGKSRGAIAQRSPRATRLVGLSENHRFARSARRRAAQTAR